MQRNDEGQWFCLACADEWLGVHHEAKTRGASLGGVALPTGVTDARRDEMTPTFRDVLGNRRTRRAQRKAR